jgi:diguanylate cyclase (GGDEF)-like protein/PAS domain S-box-containing protein
MSENPRGRVLVVDDDSRNVRLLESMLAAEGYAVATADSGPQALEQVKRAPPDVIVLDVMMPDMDGYEVARRLKSDPATRSIPLIMVTALDDRNSRLHALETGAEDFLTKPIDRAELVMRVRNLRRLKEYGDFFARHNEILEVRVAERTRQLLRTEEELRERQAGLHRAQLMARLAHAITGPDGSFESWSETLPALIGVDPGRMPKSVQEWLEILHPDDRARFRAAAIEAGSRRARADTEYRLRRGDGAWSHIRHVMEPVGGPAGVQGNTRWFSTMQDISERKQAEAKIIRLNRVYAMLSGINSAIVRIRERQELYSEACRIAVSEGGFVLARVVELGSDGRARIAATTESDSRMYQRFVDDYNSNPEHSQNLIALALRSGQPLISNDVANDLRIPDRAALTEHGNYALALLPLVVEKRVAMVVEKRVAGVVVLRAREAGMFDRDEMRLLHELVSNLAFALDHIEKANRLDYLAYYDALTGLANRSLFHERLNQYVRAARQDGTRLAMVLMDVERFKTINDSLGRQGGDELLRQLAARLGQAMNPGNIARTGGDHYAMVLPQIKGRSEIGRRVTAIWRDCFAQPFRVNETELRAAAKGGIALFPGDGADADALFASAEAALQKAQQTGERHLFHTPELTAGVADQLALENRLRQALEKDEFVLHYQPKVDLETRRIVGLEALIRWQSPELGLVPPMKFIPLMEETGLIVDVGAWALSRAVRDHSRWLEQGNPAPRVAVNVSAIQLQRRDFVATVEEALKRGVTPPAIDLEITESLIMEDVQGSIEKLKAVRSLGVSIAIDDFGTGYSSLGYLAKLPLHALKIDRSFVITMLNDPSTMSLVQTIISLAHSLRLEVIAEGVDSEDQAKILRLLRCDQMQGYLFSPPVPFDQMTALLTQGAKNA